MHHPDEARARRLLAQGGQPPQERTSAGSSWRRSSRRRWRVTPWRSWRTAPGGTSWTTCWRGTGQEGVRMWRALLDAAGPRLGSDPELAEELLVDWDALSDPTPETAEAFLAALEDERFVGQVFQGPYVGNLQRSLLGLCRRSGRAELGLALPGPGPGKPAPGQRGVGSGGCGRRWTPESGGRGRGSPPSLRRSRPTTARCSTTAPSVSETPPARMPT